MRKEIIKIISGILALFAVLLVLAMQDYILPFSGTVATSEQAVASKSADSLLEVYFFDVGQGDSEYIRTPDGQDIVIDGGPDNNVLAELGRVMPYWDREIEVMILTHPHNDHVTGLVEILRRYQVNQIYYTGAMHTAPNYLAWLEEIKKQNLKLNIVQSPFELKLADDLKLQFIYPNKSFVNQKMAELNDSSIVNLLIYKNIKYLFTGDAPEKVETELINNGRDLRADVLKVGHHGSSSSSGEKFLRAVSPRAAVISSGAGNEFGHPHFKILERLKRLKIKIMRTDELGTIKIFTDGQDLFFE